VEATTTETKDWTPVQGHVRAMPHLGLKEETLQRAKYQVGEFAGQPAHIMESRDENGRLTGQKFRTKDKEFYWLGEGKNPPLFLKWLWKSGGGKNLIITEGEKDALSYLQAFDLKYACTSLPNGTGSVEQVIKRDYEWITSFENICLSFDMDEPGQKALQQACEMLPLGKVKIIKLDRKDANDVLKEDGPGPLVKAFWNAEVYRPDGIVDGSEFTLERISSASAAGYPFPYPKLQEMTLGLRKGEITMLTAGSGIGKSTLARELAFDLHQTHGCKIGNVYLEENNTKTAQGYVALHAGIPLGRYRRDPLQVPEDVRRWALENILHKRMCFYDHFGSLENNRLLLKLHYMATVEKCDFIVLDHISIVTSGMESSSEGERKDIDIFMTRLRQLVEETGVGVIAIVHLKRTPGKNFNEGAQVSLNDFRGSASLEQLSDNAYALERNQQNKDAAKKRQTLIRVLKCREGDDTGEADTLQYNRDTGRNDLASPFTGDNESPFDPTSDDGDTASF